MRLFTTKGDAIDFSQPCVSCKAKGVRWRYGAPTDEPCQVCLGKKTILNENGKMLQQFIRDELAEALAKAAGS